MLHTDSGCSMKLVLLYSELHETMDPRDICCMNPPPRQAACAPPGPRCRSLSRPEKEQHAQRKGRAGPARPFHCGCFPKRAEACTCCCPMLRCRQRQAEAQQRDPSLPLLQIQQLCIALVGATDRDMHFKSLHLPGASKEGLHLVLQVDDLL